MSFKRKKNGIIICTTEYITNKQYGGLAVFLEKFIKTLKQKYEINLIVSSKSNKSKNYKNIKIHYVNTDSFYHKLFKKYLNWFFCILQSYIINKKVNDVIYKNKNIKFIHFSNYQFIGLFYKNSLPSITRLSSLETLWEPENFLSIKSKLEKYTLSRSDIIFSPSYFLIKELKKVYKLKSYFLPPIIEYNNIRKKNNSSRKIILTFGSISPGKGSDTIIEIINDLLILDKDINFYWIGNVDKKYYSSNKEFENILKKNTSFPNRVKVLKRKTKKQLFNFINKSKIVILPSLRDNSPNACLEALSFCKPIIARKNSGYDDLIKNKFNGFLFNKFQNTEIVQLVSSILRLDKRKLEVLNKNIIFQNKKFHPLRVRGIYENKINKLLNF